MTTSNNPLSLLQQQLSKSSMALAMSSGVVTVAFFFGFFSDKAPDIDIKEFFLFSFISVVLVEVIKNLLQRFAKRLETKLEDKVDDLADYIIDGCSSLVQLLRYRAPIRFIDRYQNFIKTFYCEVELPGPKTNLAFDCELEEVYISFNFSYDDYHKTPIQPTDEHGLSAVWYALTGGGRSSRRFHPIMITGSPGAGKTTLLKYLLLASAGIKRTRATRKFRRLTPIFLPLREIAPKILSDPSTNLATLVESQEIIQTLKPSTGWFQRKLKRGQCLVMLDGLDEIANEQNQIKIGRWIDQQIRSYSGTAFVVTSRPFSNRKEVIKEVSTFLDMRPIHFKQAEKFILSWYKHHEERKGQLAKNRRDRAALEIKAHRQANQLIVRIKQNPYLFQLTNTPLLLIMIITIYDSGCVLPKSRGALYKEICKVMIERRNYSDSLQRLINLTADQTLSVLQSLAFKLVLREQLLFS
nr:NACHT domain-containing protein [Leptolyngbyaceae cyanobacterium MAG.088]